MEIEADLCVYQLGVPTPAPACVFICAVKLAHQHHQHCAGVWGAGWLPPPPPPLNLPPSFPPPPPLPALT